MKSATGSEEKESSLCETHSSESSGRALGQSEEAEDEGSVLMKLRKMVSKPLSHMPSLALDNPVSVDGILRRPYENGVEEGRDPSPDQNDTDSLSAYEDASAETPEQDRLFLGEADTPELPHDSTANCQVNNGETQDPKTNEQCVVS